MARWKMLAAGSWFEAGGRVVDRIVSGLEGPGVKDIAAVILVCSVVYALRHAGGTVAGFIGRLEAFRRPAR